MSAARFDQAMDCVAQVMDAVRGRLELMIEGHGSFDLPTAFRIAKRLEKYDVLWFEEPIPPENLEGLDQLRGRVGFAWPPESACTMNTTTGIPSAWAARITSSPTCAMWAAFQNCIK